MVSGNASESGVSQAQICSHLSKMPPTLRFTHLNQESLLLSKELPGKANITFA
ncbi:MAG: hypothetical protein Q4P66_09890 [Actinomycetaceae bacterium]|nr:hypothetical protein [Actinomycetaceae bacterium]